ncbi:MAG: NADH-quinone oxidoreductase subunit NuoH [Candidatus Methanospirareceae archaeon]
MEMVALIDIAASNMVEIPFLKPILDSLSTIPVINYIITLILWKPIFALLFAPGLVSLMLIVIFMIWFERKLTARIQWRIGPKEVSRHIGGIIQPIADALRYLFQEVIEHKEAQTPYFIQFPIISFIPVLLPILFVNAGDIIAIRSPYAIQIMAAFVCLIPVMILGIGWASNSRFAYVGTIREAFMYFAYEIPFIITLIAMLILYGTSDPIEIVARQSSIPGIILNPVAALAFFIAIAMATSRLPFEIPEADQEIAFGPFVEYSGIIFGLVMMLAYEKMYVLGLMMTLLFLGGGNGPMIGPLGDLSGVTWFLLKTLVVLMLLAFLRSIYPRYRLDQGLRVGWTLMLILSLIALLLSILIVMV